MDDNLYDINQYTDSELYNILELVNPSDRVLEAKLIQMIQKYDILNIESGKKIAQFFKNMYNHFFYEEEEDEEIINTHPFSHTSSEFLGEAESKTKETFTSAIPPILQEGLEDRPNPPSQVRKPLTVKDMEEVTKVSQLDYTRDYINPILKQTIQRVISIDSQYRESIYPLSTDFTFNLSEPLKNVVGLRLYSVQIPYTWNTINNNYGGNFFYLKGVSPGIDNGNFDYQIDISSGNYLPNELANTINKSFNSMRNRNTDVSFGLTEITYNGGTNLATFNIQIENNFNETNYQINFNNPPQLNKYPLSTDISLNQLRYSKNYTSSLSAFLGFNNDSYCPNKIYSSRTIPSINVTKYTDNSQPSYYLDSSNNYFYIYQYDGPNPLISYNVNQANVEREIKIQLTLTGFHTRTSIFNDLNTKLIKNPYLINSKIERIDISGSYTDTSNNQYIIDNNGNSYFSLSIQLNKKNTANTPNLKTVVVFPNETNINSRIWVSEIEDIPCCFQFTDTINELNTVKAETLIKQSTYVIDSNPYFVLKCITPGYEFSVVDGINRILYTGAYTDGSWNTIDNSWNDYKITVQNSVDPTGYDLTNYIQAINTAINTTNTNSKNVSNPNGIFNINPNSEFLTMGLINNLNVDNNLLFRFDINKKFTTNSYSIDLSGTSLYHLLGLGAIKNENIAKIGESQRLVKDSSLLPSVDFTNTNIDLSSNIIITATVDSLNGYTMNSPNIITIFPNKNAKETNANASPWIVPFKGDKKISYGLYQFMDIINKSFNEFTDNGYSYPLLGSKISVIPNSNATIKTTLSIKVNKILTQNDYRVCYFDISNSWYSNLNLDNSYNLIDFSNNNISFTDIPINNISSNNYVLKDNTYFTITPITNGLETNNGLNNNIEPIIINIPATPTYYTIGQLKKIINDQFNSPENFILNGSYLDITDNRVSILLNINKIYTANDYKLVFYDFESFVKCFVGSTSVKNATLDSTLGWILGFHKQIEYMLNMYTTADSSTAILIGDTNITSNLYNYLLIVLDDYTQSHLNDGLITLTPKDSDINIPYYAPSSSLQCSTSDTPIFTGTLSNIPGTNIPGRGLTQKQIYSANQIYEARQSKIKNYSLGPYIQDIFGFIPLKVNGLQNGASYVEFGGTLQAQERIYFGPVNINRMTIKLMNDKGDTMDLNGSNWSFSFICEQLYKQTTV